MNRVQALMAFALSSLIGTAEANVGIYYGSGHTLKLISTSKVQLVSEDVTIEAVPFVRPPTMIGRAHYRGQYVLKNISSEPVSMKVGFPIDSGTMSERVAAQGTPEQLAKFVVDLGFLVRDEARTYHLEVARSSGFARRYIFHWDMKLEPGETRTLHIRYQLPISLTAASSLREPDKDRVSLSQLEKTLEPAIRVFFAYITETGASWAGPIESARFSVEFKDLKETISNKTFADMFGAPGEEKDKPAMLRKPTVFVKTSPDRFNSTKNETAQWYSAPYEPGDPIRVDFWLTWIPNHPAHLPFFIEAAYKTSKPPREKLVQLRDVLLCSMGKRAASEKVAQIVERFVWYEPKEGFDEAKLSPSQKKMLRALDRMIHDAK